MTRKQLIFNLAQWAVYETCQRIPFSSNNLGGLLTEKKNLLLILSRADLNTPIAKIVRAWNINPSDEHQFEPEFKNHEFEINGKKYSYSQIYKRLEKNTRLHKINYIHPSTNDRRSLCKMEEDSLIAAQFGIGNCTEKSGFAMTLLCEYKKENTPELIKGLQIERVKLWKNGYDHFFLILGRALDSDIKNPATWGADAAICDPWTGEFYNVAQQLELAPEDRIPMFHNYILQGIEDIYLASTMTLGDGHSQSWNDYCEGNDIANGRNLYFMDQLPSDCSLYKGGYIFCGKDKVLYYIKADGIVEAVTINDIAQFEKNINEIRKDSTFLHLSTSQVKMLITSNGGHNPKSNSLIDLPPFYSRKRAAECIPYADSAIRAQYNEHSEQISRGVWTAIDNMYNSPLNIEMINVMDNTVESNPMDLNNLNVMGNPIDPNQVMYYSHDVMGNPIDPNQVMYYSHDVMGNPIDPNQVMYYSHDLMGNAIDPNQAMYDSSAGMGDVINLNQVMYDSNDGMDDSTVWNSRGGFESYFFDGNTDISMTEAYDENQLPQGSGLLAAQLGVFSNSTSLLTESNNHIEFSNNDDSYDDDTLNDYPYDDTFNGFFY